MILQTDVALWRTIRMLEPAYLMAVEANSDGHAIGLDLEGVPLADRGHCL
jgi:hypothetical protein